MHGFRVCTHINGNKVTEYQVLNFMSFNRDSIEHQLALSHKSTMILDKFCDFTVTKLLDMHICVHKLIYKMTYSHSNSSQLEYIQASFLFLKPDWHSSQKNP